MLIDFGRNRAPSDGNTPQLSGIIKLNQMERPSSYYSGKPHLLKGGSKSFVSLEPQDQHPSQIVESEKASSQGKLAYYLAFFVL